MAVISWAQPPSILSGSEPFAYDDMRYGDAESKTVPLGAVAYVTEDMIIANTGTGEVNILPPYLAGMTIGRETVPEAVQLPEGAEVREYPFVGHYVESGKYPIEFESTVNVAVVGERRVSNIVWAENPAYDASTAITDVVKRTMPDGQYFDLQGRRVDTPKKGLYIVNGKKVMVK